MVTAVPPPPVGLFGLPRRLGVDVAARLRDDLTQLWVQQTGRLPGVLADDLELLRVSFFDPIAREERLRDAVEALLTPTDTALPDQLVLTVDGEGHTVVTPEGRVALTCLGEVLSFASGETCAFDEEVVCGAQSLLADLYRSWGRQRLMKVIALRTGVAPPLLPVGIAIVLLLLVNGSLSPETALIQEKDPARQQKLEGAALPAVSAFADILSEGRRNIRQLSLYGGYALTEARRRFGRFLVLEPVPIEKGDRWEETVGLKRLYLDGVHEEQIVDTLASELARRATWSYDDICRAFDALVRSYRAGFPVLTQFGVAHERAAHTSELRETLIGRTRLKRET